MVTEPGLVFYYAEHIVNKPYAEDVFKTAAARDPRGAFLVFYPRKAKFPEQPYAADIIKIAAEAAAIKDPLSALANVDAFANQPYAKDVLITATKEEPEFSLDSSYDFENQPYTADVIETAVRHLPASVALKYAHKFGNTPWAAKVFSVAAKEEPEVTLEQLKDLRFSFNDANKEKLVEISIKAAAEKSPEKFSALALKYATLFEDKPYAEELLIAAAKEEPEAALNLLRRERYIFSDYRDKLLEISVKAAAEKSPASLFEYADIFVKQPYAKQIFTEAARKEPEAALELLKARGEFFYFSSDDHKDELLEIAVKAAAAKSPASILEHAELFADKSYAAEAIENAAKKLSKADVPNSQELIQKARAVLLAKQPAAVVKVEETAAPQPQEHPLVAAEEQQPPKNNKETSLAPVEKDAPPYSSGNKNAGATAAPHASHYVNAASNGVGVAMAAYNIGNKFIGEDATYNIDQKAGGKQAAYANASLATDGANLASSTAAMTADLLIARKGQDTASQAVSSSATAAQATANTAKEAAQQAADAVKKAFEETSKHSAELEKAATGALAEAGEAAIIAGRLSRLSKTLGPLGIGLAGVSGGFQYKAAAEAGDGYRAAAAIGGTTGGVIGGIALGAGLGFAAGLPVFGIGAIGGAAIGAVGGLIGGFGGAMLGDTLAKHFFGDNLQLAFDEKQREAIKPQMEALAKISQKFQKNEAVFTNVMQSSAAYEQAQQSGDKTAMDKAANALIHAQAELANLPKPTDAETKQLQALQGTLAVAMVHQKAMEHPTVEIINQLQTAMNTTNAILGASSALHDATKQEMANNNQISRNKASVPFL